jgi:hypothetical protein
VSEFGGIPDDVDLTDSPIVEHERDDVQLLLLFISSPGDPLTLTSWTLNSSASQLPH